MYSNTLTLGNNFNNPIRTITDEFLDRVLFAGDDMPVGTRYMSFDKNKHLVTGVTVQGSKFCDRFKGKITGISADKDICYVDGEATFVSDIKYLILK